MTAKWITVSITDDVQITVKVPYSPSTPEAELKRRAVAKAAAELARTAEGA